MDSEANGENGPSRGAEGNCGRMAVILIFSAGPIRSSGRWHTAWERCWKAC